MAEENPFARLFNKSEPSLPEPSLGATLAVLQPGEKDEPLKVILVQADPEDTSFDCISYDRSADFGSTDIQLNDSTFSIPNPLGDALRAFRYTDRPRTLWADLLLGDRAEQRSAQAAHMKTVLSNAAQLHIWLGAGDGETKTAFDVLQSLANLWQQARLHAGMEVNWKKSSTEQLMKSREICFGHSITALRDGRSNAMIEKISRVFGSTYFESLQSTPEIVLAENRVVVEGSESITWERFNDAIMAFTNAHGPQAGPGLMSGFLSIASIETATRRKGLGESLELLPMVQGAQENKTTDPRERVFSILPIVTPSKRTENETSRPTLPKADYSLSVEEVYKQAARYIVLDRQDLLVWFSERPPSNRRLRDLPSWVPDYSVAPTKATRSPTFNHAIREWADPLDSKRISVSDDWTLHVQAHALAQIKHVTPIITSKNCRRVCLDLLQRNNDLNTSSSTRAVVFEKLWRTLALDLAIGLPEQGSIRENVKPPASLGESFNSLICEERICQLLDCTPEQLAADPALIARARSDPTMAMMGPMTGRSQEFEALLRSRALGRKFFQTETGQMGMSAVESVVVAEGGDLATDNNAELSEQLPVPDFSDIMGDMLGRSMLEAFQRHLQERDPRAAAVVSDAVEGRLDNQQKSGLKAGDLIVVMVGGFMPYVLRPVKVARSEQQEGAHASTRSLDLENDSTYRFVGDCYLHEAMAGEPLKTRNWIGMQTWKQDLKIADIRIV